MTAPEKVQNPLGVGPIAEQGNADTARSAREPQRLIGSKRKAAGYLARLHAQQADPDEPALIVSMLYVAALRGFWRVIEKALGVQRAQPR